MTHLLALTDTTLTRLDVDDLLIELLSRVQEVLDADTAAVLLWHDGSGHLVATAACGIEDEVRQGVRVPLGTGFAGQIAATRRPARLDRVDETTVSNPILWEKGIRTMLGVPLLRGDTLLGVIHVGRVEQRPFEDDDVEMLSVAADRISAAIETRGLAIERAAASLLERSLLPDKLPLHPGIDVAARYVATEDRRVGGDWYDMFTLPSGALWIVVGDVAGHGLTAAVVMGRIRSALRAYTLIESAPGRVLDLVDQKVDHFELGTIATVVCCVIEPPYDSITFAVAGHPPPIVALPGEPTRFADIAISPPLGTRIGQPRTVTSAKFPLGAVVAVYTDGLMERRGESLDVGLERLRAAVTSGPPERVARDVMRHLLTGYVPQDDIALVVIQRTEPSTDA